ncbi:hypothetical protein Lal_00032032 [Lupinus albus]|nr:hypothetical protein Lal_00032032 [Lupinus albus]
MMLGQMQQGKTISHESEINLQWQEYVAFAPQVIIVVMCALLLLSQELVIITSLMLLTSTTTNLHISNNIIIHPHLAQTILVGEIRHHFRIMSGRIDHHMCPTNPTTETTND